MLPMTVDPNIEAGAAELRQAGAGRTWFHTIDLGNGVRTPGHKDTAAEWEHLHLPDLAGRSVLDVGAYDGFFSFEAERRGAAPEW
jgi:tRNA (mo5U34)-methyltransferase